jgi:hypothetical protein
MDGWSIQSQLKAETHPMRLFLIAFALSAVFTAATSFAGNDEPLTGGSKAPGNARFEVTAAQQYLTAKAQANYVHRQSILNHYDWIGLDYGRPMVNAGVFTLAQPPIRTRRIIVSPGQFVDMRGYGFGF